MIEDARDGRFDLIVTKEISRFARNTLDSLKFTRELLNMGVAVFFQNDNINTLDEDSELRLSIMSSIAQDELRKLSSRIKFGHQQAIKSKVVLGNSNIFGYVKDKGKLVIDDTQGPIVKELFELYATDSYSMKQIEDIFWNKGYRNSNGNRIAHTTMSNIISNPKYKGYYVGNKVKVIDMFTKKQKFLSEDEWVMFKDETGDIVPAIVSEELWASANAVLRRRSNDVKNRQGICNHENLLTGKLFCEKCGTAYYRHDSRTRTDDSNSKWQCSGRIKNGKSTCPSFGIYESELKPILYDVFNDTKKYADKLIVEYIGMFNNMTTGSEMKEEKEKLNRSMDLSKKKIEKLIEMNISGKITDDDFNTLYEKCQKEIKEANERIGEIENKIKAQKEFEVNITALKRVLDNAHRDLSDKSITREFVNMYIDKIFVQPIDEHKMCLKIKVFTGETVEKYLEHLRSRTGHASKKMIENAENAMKSGK